MAFNTVIGGLVQLFNADPTLSGLVPSGAWGDEVPSDFANLPFVTAKDEGQESKWLSSKTAFARQRVRFTAYAEAATAAGQDNPASAIAKAIVAALNEQDPAGMGSNLRVLWVIQEKYTLTDSPKRSAAGNRVDVADLLLRVGVELNV